jgi:hypothetical protein
MELEKWDQIYPAGTQEGDEEAAFFIAISRNPKYIYNSTSGIAAISGLSKVRVEEIIRKYLKLGLIYANKKNDDSWGYWERMDKDDLPKDYESVLQRDQKARMKKQAEK